MFAPSGPCPHRFFIDGKRVNNSDTPHSLAMEDGDMIQCMKMQGTLSFQAAMERATDVQHSHVSIYILALIMRCVPPVTLYVPLSPACCAVGGGDR
jgi:hypothetical protein